MLKNWNSEAIVEESDLIKIWKTRCDKLLNIKHFVRHEEKIYITVDLPVQEPYWLQTLKTIGNLKNFKQEDHCKDAVPGSGIGLRYAQIFKLDKISIPLKFINLIKSFLSDTRFKVQIQGTILESREVMVGVPQGSVLSPLLFLLYPHDFLVYNNSMVALFTDDATLITTGSSPSHTNNKIQQHLKKASWCFSR